MNFQTKRENNAKIDMTPMVDIIFLLLLFFIVITTVTIESSIKVNLPQAETKSQGIDNAPVLTINKNNKLYFNGKKITLKTLPKYLAKANAKEHQGRIIVRSDGDVKHKFILTVMDISKKFGFKKIALATSPKK